MANKKQKTKEIRKMFVWILGLVLTTSAVSAGYVYFSQAFNVLEDKTKYTEICSFDLPGNSNIGEIRSVTNDQGRHIFLTEALNPVTGNRDGFYAYEEGTISDPCLGIKSLSINLFEDDFTDISAASYYLADWSLENAVFVPDIYSEETDLGYITLFMKENTAAYTKEMAIVNLRYEYGKLTYVNHYPIFDENPSFSKIVDLHYTYEDNTLYIFGVSESEGLRNRGIRTAAISHEDLLSGDLNMNYCQMDDADGLCYWQNDPLKATITIASKNGDLDVLGIEDELHLMIQNDDKEVKIYDLAEEGTTWNPGLRLMSCDVENSCENIVTYDYQSSYFENVNEKVEVMTFYLLSSNGRKLTFSEGRVDDFSITNTVTEAFLPMETTYAALIIDVSPSGSSGTTTSKVTANTGKASSKSIKSKTKTKSPQNTQPKTTVKTKVVPKPAPKSTQTKDVKSMPKETADKEVKYIAKGGKKTEKEEKTLLEKILPKKTKDKSMEKDVEVSKLKIPTKGTTKNKGISIAKSKAKITEKSIPKNSVAYEEKTDVPIECFKGMIKDNVESCVAEPPKEASKCDEETQYFDSESQTCKDYIQMPEVELVPEVGEEIIFNGAASGAENVFTYIGTPCGNKGVTYQFNGGGEYCFEAASVYNQNEGICEGIQISQSGDEFCVFQNNPAAPEEVELVPTDNSACPYGAISSANAQKCEDQLIHCPSNVNTYRVSKTPSYAAYAKCISGNTVVAACPANTRLDSTGTKCVVPGYKDEALQKGGDLDKNGDVYLGVDFSPTDGSYNKLLAEYIKNNYWKCPASYTECLGSGTVLQRSGIDRCYKTTSNGIGVFSCCAPGYYIRDGVCKSAENIRVDNNGTEATQYPNCEVGTHAIGACVASADTPLCSSVGRAHIAYKLWADVASKDGLSPSNPTGQCLGNNGNVYNYWKY